MAPARSEPRWQTTRAVPGFVSEARDYKVQIYVRVGHRKGWRRLLTFTLRAANIIHPDRYTAYSNAPAELTKEDRRKADAALLELLLDEQEKDASASGRDQAPAVGWRGRQQYGPIALEDGPELGQANVSAPCPPPSADEISHTPDCYQPEIETPGAKLDQRLTFVMGNDLPVHGKRSSKARV